MLLSKPRIWISDFTVGLLQAAYADEVHEIKPEFAELRNLALDEKRHHFFRVEAAGEVVERHLNDILAHFFRVVDVVGEGLCVGDEYGHLLEVAFVLELYAAAQREPT